MYLEALPWKITEDSEEATRTFDGIIGALTDIRIWNIINII
jgi:hypothetical protein